MKIKVGDVLNWYHLPDYYYKVEKVIWQNKRTLIAGLRSYNTKIGFSMYTYNKQNFRVIPRLKAILLVDNYEQI